MGIEKYSVERIGSKGRPAIWAVSGNSTYPICYLQKPKWMTDEQFQKVVDAIRLNAEKDFLDSPAEGMEVK